MPVALVDLLDALGRTLNQPTDHFRRRTTQLTVLDRKNLAVEVSTELVVPGPPVGPEDNLSEGDYCQRLISIGLFAKHVDRLPDLVARSGSDRLPIVGRGERIDWMTRLLLSNFTRTDIERRRAAGELDPRDDIRPLDELTPDTRLHMMWWFRQIVGHPDPEVSDQVRSIFLRSLGTSRIFEDAVGWERSPAVAAAAGLAVSDIHILAWIDARPNENVVVELSYTQPIEPLGYFREFILGDAGGLRFPRPVKFGLKLLRGLLRMVGLRPLAVSFDEPCAEHVESMWLTAHAPIGLTTEDIFWEAVDPRPAEAGLPGAISDPTPVEASEKTAESASAVAPPRRQISFLDWLLPPDPPDLGSQGDPTQEEEWEYEHAWERGRAATLGTHRRDEGFVRTPRRVWFGLQMAPTSSAFAAAILSFCVAYTLGRLATGDFVLSGNNSTVANAALLAIPGFFVGGLTLMRPGSSILATSMPRLLLGGVAVSPYVVAIGRLTSGTNQDWIESFSHASAAYAVAVGVLLLFISLPMRGTRGYVIGQGGHAPKRRRHYRGADLFATFLLAICLLAGHVAWELLGTGMDLQDLTDLDVSLIRQLLLPF